jgi:hypothetical protein
MIWGVDVLVMIVGTDIPNMSLSAGFPAYPTIVP